jgi:hypothetical protein
VGEVRLAEVSVAECSWQLGDCSHTDEVLGATECVIDDHLEYLCRKRLQA